jgi:uridine monophosphate synthetase
MIDLEPVALTLYDIGAVQIGKFKLHSGHKSSIYLDLRLLASYPQALRQVSTAYYALIKERDLQFDLLAAAPLAGLPIGTALALEMDMPLIYPRKTAKNYGTGKSIEGVYSVGQTAVIIDDLVTSGDSIISVAVPLKAAGLTAVDAIVLIDREQGGKALLADAGYNLHAVFTLNFLLAVLEKHDRITGKEHARVLRKL